MLVRGVTELTAAMVLSGTIGAVVVLSGLSSLEVVAWRCLFGAIPLALACYFLGYFRKGIISRRQFFFAVLAGAGLVTNWFLLFAAFPLSSISIATVVYNTQPFILVAMGALVLRERITLGKLGWLIFAFAGVVLLTLADSGQTGSNYLLGVLLAFGAAFFYAFVALTAKQLVGVPPHLIALIQVSVGIVLAAPLALMSPLPTGATAWVCLVTLGMVHTGLMYILLYGGYQKLPTHLIGALSFVYPVVAIIVDFVVFGQRLSLPQMLGAAIVLFAAAAMTLGWMPFSRKTPSSS
jgi:drug/metabolite transporter (DMT)-like permease